jgi:hypothetical protein
MMEPMTWLVQMALAWAAAELSEPHANHDTEVDLYEELMFKAAKEWVEQVGEEG